MPSFVLHRLIWAVVALAALVACPIAGAVPSPDPSGRPASASAGPRPALARPLPTLVPPANDAIGAAEAIPAIPFATSLSTLEATSAPGDPSCAGNAASVWYAYTPPVTVWLTAESFGSDYDTTLSAYTGVPGSLAQVACNDDVGGLQSQLTFLADGGVTYYLMAAGKSGGGALELALDVRPPLAQVGVRTTSASENSPAAGPEHFAWSHWPRRNGRFWTAYVQPAGEARFAANRRRTNGFPGGFDGETFAYQETRGNASDLVLYDLATGKRASPPAGVNTGQWEWHPTISGDWLLFGRHNERRRTDLVVLRNLVTDETRVLDRLTRTARFRWSEPGQVSGNHAVWYRCSTLCRVFHHDVATGTTTEIPGLDGRHQYEPAVTDDGTMYFLNSRDGCGNAVRIVRRSPAGTMTVLRPLPPRWDSFRTYALENADGTNDFFFARVHCSRSAAQDIFKVVDP